MDIANAINNQSGGPLIGAWQVDQLPQEWINAFMAISRGLPKMHKGIALIKKKKEEIVSKHTTYRPIPKRH